jgi:DNA mismatch repair protein MutL
MQPLIRLLPDHIANQIAAGEVVQRPASVVKELMENAIDAGATQIDVLLRDAGKALIQVIDNGSGMAPDDARMCFERHATSKIREAEDLFRIRTMGFRGEAMASIAAVAQIHMRTRLHDAEHGTEIIIEGSEVKRHEPCVCAPGTSIAVKNLFFNIPARRNFLKSNPVETRHILAEFTRIALAHPGVSLKLEHNSTNVYSLSGTSQSGRIAQLFGDDMGSQMVEVGEETPYLTVRGFVGTPEAARKARGEQFFFCNERFIKSAYLHHAVMAAYKDLLREETFPFYCFFLSIDPSHVDVNIHPTKTEIKFDDERTVYSLLHSVIRKGLSRLHQAPELPFSDLQMKELIQRTPPRQEEMTLGQFHQQFRPQQPSAKGWEELFATPQTQPDESASELPANPVQALFNREESQQDLLLMQIQGQYILTLNRNSLLVIDQQLAHERVLYERFLNARQRPPLASQQLLFPRSLTFSPSDMEIVQELETQFHHLGFDLKPFGKDRYLLHGLPAGIAETASEQIFEEVIAEARESEQGRAGERMFHRIAAAIARRGATAPGKRLGAAEMRALVEDLFQCEEPARSPSGRPTYFTADFEMLRKFFGRS